MARKYQVPAGMTSVSVDGVECKANKKGIVEVPDTADDEQLRAHGLTGVDSDVEAAPEQ